VKNEAMRERIEALARGEADPRGREGKVVDDVIERLDQGLVRVAEVRDDEWVTNAWVKAAILLYFTRHDRKIPLKRNYRKCGVRCVRPGAARYGSFLAPGVILMPAFVNIGAYVGEGTMIDTWATVGSCAQIGKGVHLSGGVGIGGVLEPPQASPVIVEDGAFVGSRCILVEGVRVEREAVLGAGVVVTASTPILDVRGSEPVTIRGRIPARAVVIPGTQPKRFPAGEYGTPCALIIGTRDASTDLKTSLNVALREHELAV
jgi:2,3,4,5-tetrahydropyridine-2-carboxylate N-succinyltransferase